MSGLWVKAWNGLANQTEIRIVNSSKYSYKVRLQVGGVTYQEALLPFVKQETESSVLKNKRKALFSSVSLPCGYFWYTVTATRFDPFSQNQNELECQYLCRVFGGRTVFISEGSNSKMCKMTCIEGSEVCNLQQQDVSCERKAQNTIEEPKVMLEASHCKSTYSNRSISSGESTDVEDEEEHYAKEIKIPKSGNERYLEAEIPKSDELEKLLLKYLEGMWVLDSQRSDNMEEFMQMKGISYFKRKAARHITQKQKIQPLPSNFGARVQIKNIAGPITEITEVDIGSTIPHLTGKGEKVCAKFVKSPAKLKEVLPLCILVKFVLPNGDKQTVYHGISRTNKNEKHMYIHYDNLQARRSTGVHLVSVKNV